ncbi:MAG: rRNA (cytidine-2'-O-)-methyltransferase, partial [Armatimonadetes bacterium]|nr:rRNA (cytidine-2'-O-)-methyltransferase [Armatimonadota bacterium]
MGKLTLVAGPIGNLGDLTARAAETLRTADLWFVEDSRVSAKLLGHLGVSKPMRVLNEHTSDYKLAEYIKELSDLHGVVLSDGGTPCVSDPGAMLCDLAHESG